MAVLQEIDRLLSRAAPAKLEAEVVRGEIVHVARLNGDAELVYGLFGYQRRVVEVPGRPLTFALTKQPIWAVREGDRVTSLAYAEDVVRHPLKNVLVGQLVNSQPGRLPR